MASLLCHHRVARSSNSRFGRSCCSSPLHSLGERSAHLLSLPRSWGLLCCSIFGNTYNGENLPPNKSSQLSKADHFTAPIFSLLPSQDEHHRQHHALLPAPQNSKRTVPCFTVAALATAVCLTTGLRYGGAGRRDDRVRQRRITKIFYFPLLSFDLFK